MTASERDSARARKLDAWTRPAVRGMRPYYQAPLEGDPLRLDQNTNLFGRNPALDRIGPIDASQYPTRDSDPLRVALAAEHGLTPDHFVVANGSDELLDLLGKAFTEPSDRMATLAPSYSLYPYYARLAELDLVEVPCHGPLHRQRVDVEAVLAAKAKITLLATPNNPTGGRVPTDDLERIVDGAAGLVVIDEAYIEYAGEEHSWLRRVDEHEHVAVMRTFSKAHGLAGLRIGYMAANPDLAARLRLVKAPYNLNLHSEAAAIAALADTAWMRQGIATVRDERDRLAEGLGRRGLRVVPSDANFLLCETPDDPALLAARLRRQGILARTFPGRPGLEHAIRFTVGRPGHTDRLLDALDAEGP